jgi:hypothetical protein
MTLKPCRPVKCRKPKMSTHKGATWDKGSVVWKGVKRDCWLDTSWGHFAYFHDMSNENGAAQWYKFRHGETFTHKAPRQVGPGNDWNLDQDTA